MLYLVKTPWLVRKMFPSYTWNISTKEKIIYLTFDDGPHPHVTPFVLDQLKQHNARASFFCVGENVKSYPHIYEQTIRDEHVVGNHTFNHINGRKSTTEQYINNVQHASEYISSKLFRPPYGGITRGQARALINKPFEYKIVMWDVLSADFDTNVHAERCVHYVLKNSVSGSIIVFHDSEKAFPRLQTALPIVLNHFKSKGFAMRGLPAI